jgi:hypothetical protein
MREPETHREYLDEQNSYLFIRRTIQQAIDKDKSSYPLSGPLLHLHGVCSKYGSHADVSAFVHRLRVRPTEDGTELREHLMFQYPEDENEFRYYIVSTMSAFLLMLGVFSDALIPHAQGFEGAGWKESTANLVQKIEKERSRLAAIGQEQGKAAGQAEVKKATRPRDGRK